MKKRARKAWNGGKRPELTPDGKAWVAHVQHCHTCSDGKWIFGECVEGLALYAAFQNALPETPV